MAATYRQCGICLDWRTDVATRGHVLDHRPLCPDCTRVFGTRTQSAASAHEQAKSPQESRSDRLARFEESLGRDLQERGRTRKLAHTRHVDHRAGAVPTCHLD